MNPTVKHVEKRYGQAEIAHRNRLDRRDAGKTLMQLVQLTPQEKQDARITAEQMTRICRRCKRMIRAASN